MIMDHFMYCTVVCGLVILTLDLFLNWFLFAICGCFSCYMLILFCIIHWSILLYIFGRQLRRGTMMLVTTICSERLELLPWIWFVKSIGIPHYKCCVIHCCLDILCRSFMLFLPDLLNKSWQHSISYQLQWAFDLIIVFKLWSHKISNIFNFCSVSVS